MTYDLIQIEEGEKTIGKNLKQLKPKQLDFLSTKLINKRKFKKN